MESERQDARRKLVAVVAVRRVPADLADVFNSDSPYQQIASAWNLIMAAREGLTKDQYEQSTEILSRIDTLLLAIHPSVTDEPVPLPVCNCWRHRGDTR